MAGERHIEVKVGVLVVVCLGILVAFIMILGDFSTAPSGVVYLDVDTSASLKPGATVKIAGVNAGKVATVEYRGGEVDAAVGRPVYVRVGIGMDKKMLETLRRSSRFYITTLGVLGEKYVEIDPGTDEAPFLKDGDVLVGEPPLRLEVMALNANRVLATLADVLKKNEKLLDDMIRDAAGAMATIRRTVDRIDGVIVLATPKIDKVVDQIASVGSEVEKTVRGLNTMIGDGTELRQTVLDVGAITGRLRNEVGPIASDVKKALARVDGLGAEVSGLIAEAKAAALGLLARVEAVVADAKALTERLKDGQGTVGALLSDREMYDDLREMMKDLRRHPWKFIWKE